MATLPVRLGPATWSGGSFRPYGRVAYVGRKRANPATRTGGVYAARLFVGFSVDEVPTYSMDDLMQLVQEERAEYPDATFVAQKGICLSSARENPAVHDREERAPDFESEHA